MDIDRDLILVLISLAGAWSAASMFLYFISAYKNLEEAREKRKKGNPYGLVLRFKFLMMAAGSVSAIMLYFKDPELFNYVAWIMITIFIFWLVIQKKPPF